MKSTSRRRFLQSAALLSGAALPGAAPANAQGAGSLDDTATMVLRAVALHVLPVETLGRETAADLVSKFSRWSDGFEPVAELDHPYLSSDEVRYGPPDPRPLWRAQLEALERESRQRYGVGFVECEGADRDLLLRRHLRRHSNEGASAALPDPEHAGHVALALMSWYFKSSAANDLCYGAAIGRHDCRGLPSAVDRPSTLPKVVGDRELP